MYPCDQGIKFVSNKNLKKKKVFKTHQVIEEQNFQVAINHNQPKMSLSKGDFSADHSENRKQQQQFSPLKKQLVESMADVRPGEYLGFHSLE